MSALVLPPTYMVGDETDPERYIHDLAAFLSTPLADSLAMGHVNNIAGDNDPDSIPSHWKDWWDSDWVDQVDFKSIVTDMVENRLSQDVPESVKSFVVSVHNLCLPRIQSPHIPPFRIADSQRFGLSPKKQHEVENMCGLIQDMCQKHNVRHVVDVGAGQGYLTRNLAASVGLDVLALDSSDHQVQGAQKREDQLRWWQDKKAGKKVQEEVESTTASMGTISRDIVWVDSDNLPRAIDKWVATCTTDEAMRPLPVIILGLHACGSLTPAVLRSFTSTIKSNHHGNWRTSGLALVGCCYNKIRDFERDFPLSQIVRSSKFSNITSLHFHLAAQITHNWLTDWSAFALGVRKVVFRATLERLFSKEHHGKMYEAGLMVGKFNDSTYDSWEIYRRRCAERLPFTEEELIQRELDMGEVTAKLQRRLEFLHVLRCMLGPVIEGMILMDRYMFLKEQLGNDDGIQIQMLNIFDQSTGSARNIAFVVETGLQNESEV